MTTDDHTPSPTPKSLALSPTLVRLRQDIRNAKTREERATLMLALAAQFDKEHNHLDDGLTDNYHAYFEEYEGSRLQFHHAAFRLARLALSVIDDEAPEGSVPPPSGPPNTNIN